MLHENKWQHSPWELLSTRPLLLPLGILLTVFSSYTMCKLWFSKIMHLFPLSLIL